MRWFDCKALGANGKQVLVVNKERTRVCCGVRVEKRKQRTLSFCTKITIEYRETDEFPKGYENFNALRRELASEKITRIEERKHNSYPRIFRREEH